MKPALTLENAQARVLKLALPMPSEDVALNEAVGRYLSADIKSRRTQPSADLSAMDGYALGPQRPNNDQWELVGESRAGMPWDETLRSDETIRISTGAHVPKGADRILIQENCDVADGKVTLTSDYPDHLRHVRERGFDFASGDLLISTGTRINAAHIALAASGGHSTLPVAHMPHVAILDSGDELARDPASAGEHELPASNGVMLEAMVRQFGCAVSRLGPVGDDADDLAEALKGAEDADILITTGGASVGDHDLMQPALEAWGAELDFWRVAMKPGKPIMIATREGANGKQVIFGLPGNPVSAFVTAFLFALPLIKASMGDKTPCPAAVSAVAGTNLPAIGVRREFTRAHWNGSMVAPAGSQDSSALAALASANCLIDRPANSPAISAGDAVAAYVFGNVGLA
ncbi:MAG: gephyrin-like molybdotransferase Glp [Erythrobacter sp.]